MQHLLPQQNVRIPEEDEIMADPGGVSEYIQAMSDDYGGAYNLILSKLSKTLPERGAALDIGTGPGVLLCKMAELFPGIEWLGIDLSPAMLQRAEERIAKRRLSNVRVRQWDIHKIDSLPETFDFVCVSLTLHHVRTEAEALALINSCVARLKPDGVLFIFDLVRPKTDHMARFVADHYIKEHGALVYKDGLASMRAAFSFRELKAVLEESHFKHYEHVRNALGVYQYVITKRTHQGTRPTLPPMPLKQRMIFLWQRLLFYGKM
jgi:SAM-dependent methyltransferase